ncbi:hypothetical protein Zmor_010277 [Zophobas morio]|uniref:Uncharacterized protein n=1 Tax=Zophobas morio TaxID=2755281 RepID=A0AA38IIR9_9CUCU|nr:hypothetical protein Zmor_010277 [Zophobas morio]
MGSKMALLKGYRIREEFRRCGRRTIVSCLVHINMVLTCLYIAPACWEPTDPCGTPTTTKLFKQNPQLEKLTRFFKKTMKTSGEMS